MFEHASRTSLIFLSIVWSCMNPLLEFSSYFLSCIDKSCLNLSVGLLLQYRQIMYEPIDEILFDIEVVFRLCVNLLTKSLVF